MILPQGFNVPNESYLILISSSSTVKQQFVIQQVQVTVCYVTVVTPVRLFLLLQGSAVQQRKNQDPMRTNIKKENTGTWLHRSQTLINSFQFCKNLQTFFVVFLCVSVYWTGVANPSKLYSRVYYLKFKELSHVFRQYLPFNTVTIIFKFCLLEN